MEAIKIIFFFIACGVGIIFGLGVVMLYARNLFKVIKTVQGDTQFSLRTILRVFGIFMPLLGVAMGFVNGS